MGASQTNNRLSVHVLNYKNSTFQSQKKQLILYVVKDVVDHSIQNWGRYKDCGEIITVQMYKDGIDIILSFYCIIVLSHKNIFHDKNQFKLG